MIYVYQNSFTENYSHINKFTITDCVRSAREDVFRDVCDSVHRGKGMSCPGSAGGGGRGEGVSTLTRGPYSFPWARSGL